MEQCSKKGYSGTALFTKIKPLSVTYGIGMEEHDQEGRVITADFNDHCLVTCYTPNSQRGLARLTYRMKWEDDFKNICLIYLKKPVILCGDLNVAHEEIDLANPASNHMNAGFTDDERNKMTELLSDGFTDSFRYLHQDKRCLLLVELLCKIQERNIGWRIDYFLVSDILQPRIKAAEIHSSILGSDHCPVELDIEI